MKKSCNYYKIKWTAFFITVLVLGIGLTAIYISRPQTEPPQTENQQTKPPVQNSAGHYTNEAFGNLIEENLTELGFIKNIGFSGKSEGQFTLTGTLSAPERLVAVCPELKSFSVLLNALKGEKVTVKGHIGEDDGGNGCFVTDTITFSGYTLPAAVATSYIEEYTGLNDLLEVPINQISLTEDGITFKQELPTAIQIALYN